MGDGMLSLPGHGSVLQARVDSPEQSAPPFAGAGFAQVLA